MTITIDRDLALAFFEWSYQFMVDHNPMFQHPADALAVDEIAGELERTLAEPFHPEYAKLLSEARERALRRYDTQMGDDGSSWLRRLEYQSPPGPEW